MDVLAGLVDAALASTHMDSIDALRIFFILASCTVRSAEASEKPRQTTVGDDAARPGHGPLRM
ncbi:hypothetical protein BP00DRAFT_428045, partial [Aspergillus indologenus CBS 114.80]